MIRLLDILCEMTSGLKMFTFLQDYPDLLETTVGKYISSICIFVLYIVCCATI